MADTRKPPSRRRITLPEQGSEKAPAGRRGPLRWNPMQRDRSRPEEPRPPAEQVPAARRKPPSRPVPKGRPSPGHTTRLTLFAPCPRGLEAELAKELRELGAGDPVAGAGGVGFRGDLSLAWRVNLWSRLAVRVLWRVSDGGYRIEDDLYRAALDLPWPEWFAHDRSIAVRTVAHGCPLKSLNFLTLRIKDAVCDRFRQDDLPRPNVDPRNPDVPILLYLERDRFSLYIDLSGEPLNRRGYRVEPAPAPLNENLAAGLLRLAGWTPQVPLLDPMMGGGTILLEAAMIALNMAPGLKRHFAFENLANFDKLEWTRLRKDAQAARLEARALPIQGMDVDPLMVRAAGLNLKAAGLLDCVTLNEGDVLEIASPGPTGIIISNPPYGVRLGVGAAARGEVRPEDFAVFYHALGDALKQRFSGWAAYLLSADPDLPRRIGLKATRRTPLYNGALECRLYEYRMVAGTMRVPAP